MSESWYGSDSKVWAVVGTLLAVILLVVGLAVMCEARSSAEENYPWHHDIVATTFWVGEVIGNGPNDSQRISAYDENWYANYGGCDGVVKDGSCETEPRTAANDYFPTQMTPRQNPFYLDLPVADPSLKDRWVQIGGPNGNTCYGQIEDAGPAVYDDRDYVFGGARPANTRFNGTGMDVSPALNGCLGFAELNGSEDRVNWRFVDSPPPGPWTRIITR
jgi:hypothetical protein